MTQTQLKPFSPEDYPDRICCGFYEYFKANGFEVPLYKPIFVENTQLTARGLGMKFFKVNKDGKPVGNSVTLLINFCPFCGADIGIKENG